MKRILQFAGLCLALYLVAGCSTDSVQIISQASLVKPGDTISVKLVSAYLYVTDSSVVNIGATRDSLHVAFGLPQGWSVVSMDYYAAYNFKIPGMWNQTLDTTALLNQDYSPMTQQMDSTLEQAFAQKNLQDSLANFEAAGMPMDRDSAMEAAFAGRTINAHDQGNTTTIAVSTDSVKNWDAFSSRVGITLPAGTRTDAAIAVPDTVNKLIEAQTGLPIKVDTAGVVAIPIFVFAKVKTGPAEGTFTMYYYTKTDKLPPVTPNTSNPLEAADVGSMVYSSIQISNNASVRYLQERGVAKGFSISPNPLSEQSVITLPKGCSEVSMYDIHGALVRTLRAEPGHSLVWNGTDTQGAVVRPGSYIAKIYQNGAGFTRTVQVLR